MHAWGESNRFGCETEDDLLERFGWIVDPDERRPYRFYKIVRNQDGRSPCLAQLRHVSRIRVEGNFTGRRLGE